MRNNLLAFKLKKRGQMAVAVKEGGASQRHPSTASCAVDRQLMALLCTFCAVTHKCAITHTKQYDK